MAMRKGKHHFAEQWAQREARQAQRKSVESRVEVRSFIQSRHPKQAATASYFDSDPVVLEMASTRTNTLLNIQLWKSFDPDTNETTLWITIRMLRKPDSTKVLELERMPKEVLYEGPLDASQVREVRNEFCQRIAEQFGTHMLGASTPDDPFYMDELDY